MVCGSWQEVIDIDGWISSQVEWSVKGNMANFLSLNSVTFSLLPSLQAKINYYRFVYIFSVPPMYYLIILSCVSRHGGVSTSIFVE